MVKRRGGLKPGAQLTVKTDFSFANEYLEERKYGKWRRIKVTYHQSYDRRAANINYESQTTHRTFRGSAPILPTSRDELTTQKPKNLNNPEYQFVSDAKDGTNIPEGYYGTVSGIEPIVVKPFTIPYYGYTTDNPTQVDCNYQNNTPQVEFMYGKNIETEYGYYPRYPFKNSYDESVGKFEWWTSEEFDNPTEPELRYPKRGSKRRKFFSNS